MGFYSSPEEMYKARASRYKKEGDRHWAMAKQGEGGFHYSKARACYEQERINQAKAERSKQTGATFRKK